MQVRILVHQQLLNSQIAVILLTLDGALAKCPCDNVQDCESSEDDIEHQDHNPYGADLVQRSHGHAPLDAACDRLKQRHHRPRHPYPICPQVLRELVRGYGAHDPFLAKLQEAIAGCLGKNYPEEEEDHEQQRHGPDDRFQSAHDRIQHRAQCADETDDACDAQDADHPSDA
eukprot:CAMPEP_0115323238 /NCGR_PEP_ID=MMETSP0270-20121206/81834_1 /TAXON_ID=71861 /ORGANISM="Scrippsiella trochoidea, Strain CCMP3099" /LENGTH=171 /DNA_ID=CAMNT_0002743267 /DNA_START=342 /DNA_END=857 /DNA_ORIENTATION=-